MGGTVVLAILAALAFAASGIQLLDLDGNRVAPMDAKTAVLVFTRTDCPISNRYAPELTRLYRKFEPQGIRFWMIYVDPREAVENIRAHHREYGYAMPALLDRKHEMARVAGAELTPEAAVYSRGQLVYRGRIDNRYVSFGKARSSATEHDLEHALEDLLAGRTPAAKVTHAVGCYIGDLK